MANFLAPQGALYSMPLFLSTLIEHSLFSDFHSTEHHWHASHSGSLLEYRCNSGVRTMQYHNHNTTPCKMQMLTLTERAWVLYLFPLETPCRAQPVHVFDKWERWVRRFPTKVSQTAPTKEAETDESVFAAGLCARCHSATVRSEKRNDFLPDSFFCHFVPFHVHFFPFRAI